MVVVLALCIWAWFYGQSLSDDHAVQQLIASATAVAAVGGISAFLVLVAYTIETRRLRKTTDEQLEGSIKPVVLLEVALDGCVPGALRYSYVTIQFRNVGMGPAFCVAVEPIVGENVVLHIERIPLIESKAKIPANFRAVQNPSEGGMGCDPSLLLHLFVKNRFPDKTQMTVSCKGLSGKHYNFYYVIRHNPDDGKTWTEFDRIEQG
jgi:hypothetical protein